MGTRGRKSTADLSVVVQFERTERPKPPQELTHEQSEVWRAVANSLPADWFTTETLPLLIQYCRHTVSSKRVAQLIERAEVSEDFDVEEYDRLLKMQERETRCLASLAVKMRISQSTTYDKSRKKGAQGKPPWEEE